jgi:hypothetical protein
MNKQEKHKCTLAEPAIRIFAGVMHYEHHGNAGDSRESTRSLAHLLSVHALAKISTQNNHQAFAAGDRARAQMD